MGCRFGQRILGILGCRQAVRLRTLTPSFGSSNLSTPAKQKEQASACSFCFTCEAVKERFELRATPPDGKTVLWTVFSDDRRYLQSIGLNFRICFANIKRKISPPQPNKNTVSFQTCRVFSLTDIKFDAVFSLYNINR